MQPGPSSYSLNPFAALDPNLRSTYRLKEIIYDNEEYISALGIVICLFYLISHLLSVMCALAPTKLFNKKIYKLMVIGGSDFKLLGTESLISSINFVIFNFYDVDNFNKKYTLMHALAHVALTIASFFSPKFLIEAVEVKSRLAPLFLLHLLFAIFDCGAHVNNLSVFLRIQKFQKEMLLGVTVVGSVLVLVYYSHIGIFSDLLKESQKQKGASDSVNESSKVNGEGKRAVGRGSYKGSQNESAEKLKENKKMKQK